MPSYSRVLRRVLTALVITVLVLISSSSVFAGRRWLNRPKEDGPPGNLAVMSFQLYEIGVGSTRHQILARVLIENQSPLDRLKPFRVVVLRDEDRTARLGKQRNEIEILGTCNGEALPRGQVAICDIWLRGGLIEEGESIIAVLDRSIESFDIWDGEAGNDRRSAALRTMPGGGHVLRVASWEVRPRILHGMGEVQFRFTVEGAHLVWLLSQEEDEPRLIAGHPADGLLTGKGLVRVRSSGPLTLVARNSLGAFVYETIPVLNSYQQPKPSWVQSPVDSIDDAAVARVLDPGVYEEDDNEIILKNLRLYLGTKNWAVELERLRRLGESDRPMPANVLNPKARERK